MSTLTSMSGHRFFVFTQHIVSIRQQSEGSSLYLGQGDSLDVRETPLQIIDAISQSLDIPQS